jgi:hypothetical protein
MGVGVHEDRGGVAEVVSRSGHVIAVRRHPPLSLKHVSDAIGGREGLSALDHGAGGWVSVLVPHFVELRLVIHDVSAEKDCEQDAESP